MGKNVEDIARSFRGSPAEKAVFRFAFGFGALVMVSSAAVIYYRTKYNKFDAVNKKQAEDMRLKDERFRKEIKQFMEQEDLEDNAHY